MVKKLPDLRSVFEEALNDCDSAEDLAEVFTELADVLHSKAGNMDIATFRSAPFGYTCESIGKHLDAVATALEEDGELSG